MKADEIIDQAIRNAMSDRQAVQVQITDLNKSMQNQSETAKHATYGQTFAKYAETLQRSNEQLIKLADLARKIEETKPPGEDEDVVVSDVDSIYAALKEEDNDRG